jgi:ferredoxin
MLKQIQVIFVLPDGTEQEVYANEGESLLHVAHENHVPLEGACEGSLACSTCHVVVDAQYYSKLDAATDDEEDMLDLAFGLTHTSRLGCQILLKPELNGLRVSLPSATRNMMV